MVLVLQTANSCSFQRNICKKYTFYSVFYFVAQDIFSKIICGLDVRVGVMLVLQTANLCSFQKVFASQISKKEFIHKATLHRTCYFLDSICVPGLPPFSIGIKKNCAKSCKYPQAKIIHCHKSLHWFLFPSD